MADKRTYTVEAVLQARDANFSSAFNKANSQVDALQKNLAGTDKPAKSVKDTLLGVAGAIGVTKALGSAWGYLKGNLQGAMDRLDTMDSYQRTIKLMTGDTNKASKSLDELARISKGTAYGLDTMAMATQGFVTSAYKVEDATRYVEGWGNAIATFGSGTDSALSSTMYQLNQLASKGKANLGDLKTAMEQGIPVLQIYAEQTGMSMEDVSDAISKGSISATEFLETMDKAFRNGTKSFPPLTNAAKNAGGSWSATFANMGAATKRGIATVITSIEDGRKRSNLPTMKDNISSFGKNTEKVLKSLSKVTGHVAENFEAYAVAVGGLAVAKNADKWILSLRGNMALMRQTSEEGLFTFLRLTEGMQKGYSVANIYSNAIKSQATAEEIRNSAKKIGIVLDETMQKDAVTGLALTNAQKTAIIAETGALSLKSVAIGVLSGNIKISTALQLLWNKAIMANPIGLIIGGVVALTSGLLALNKYLNKTSEEQRKANQDAEDYKNSVSSTVDSVKELTNAYNENIKQTKTNSTEAKALVNNISKLGKESGNSAYKQSQMTKSVEKLNKLYPNLNAEIDKSGKAIKGGTEKIKEYIKAEEELSNNSHQLKYIDELKSKRNELNAQQDIIKAKMQELERQGTDTQKAFFGMFNVQSDAMKSLQEAMDNVEQGISDVDLEINALNNTALSNEEVMKRLNTVYGITSDAVLAFSDRTGESVTDIAGRLTELSDKYGLTADEIINDIERQGIGIDEWVTRHEELEEAKEKLSGLSEKYGLTADEIIASADRMGLTLEEWEERYSNTLDRAKGAVGEFADATLSGFNKLEQESAISLGAYMENLRSNIEATDSWTENTKKLMEAGISGGVIAELDKMGPAGAATAKEFVAELEALNGGSLGKFDELSDGAKARIEELEALMSKGMASSAEAAKTSMQAQDYAQMGRIPPEEIANSYLAEKGIIDSATKKTFVDTPKSNLDKTKPMFKQNMDENNQAVREGFSKMENSISDASRRIQGKTNDMAKGIVRSFNGLPNQLHNSGYNAGIGFLNGLWSTSGRIYALASQIANTVTSRINTALAIHSPSRKTFKSGKFTGEGFEKGMKNQLPKIEKVADEYSAIPLSINSSYSVQSLNDNNLNAREVQPTVINLALGNREYSVFVEDITEAQDRKVALQLSY